MRKPARTHVLLAAMTMLTLVLGGYTLALKQDLRRAETYAASGASSVWLTCSVFISKLPYLRLTAAQRTYFMDALGTCIGGHTSLHERGVFDEHVRDGRLSEAVKIVQRSLDEHDLHLVHEIGEYTDDMLPLGYK